MPDEQHALIGREVSYNTTVLGDQTRCATEWSHFHDVPIREGDPGGVAGDREVAGLIRDGTERACRAGAEIHQPDLHRSSPAGEECQPLAILGDVGIYIVSLVMSQTLGLTQRLAPVGVEGNTPDIKIPAATGKYPTVARDG